MAFNLSTSIAQYQQQGLSYQQAYDRIKNAYGNQFNQAFGLGSSLPNLNLVSNTTVQQGPTQSGVALDSVPSNTTIGNEQQGPNAQAVQEASTTGQASAAQSAGNTVQGSDSNVGPYQSFTSSADGQIDPLGTGLLNNSNGQGGTSNSGTIPVDPTAGQIYENGFDPSISGSPPASNANTPYPTVTGTGTSTPGSGYNVLPSANLPINTKAPTNLADLGSVQDLTSLLTRAKRGILSTIFAGNTAGSSNPLVQKPVLLGSS